MTTVGKATEDAFNYKIFEISVGLKTGFKENPVNEGNAISLERIRSGIGGRPERLIILSLVVILMTYSQAATNDTSQGRRRSGGSPRGPTRFPESSRDRGQGERVGFLESWQNGTIGSAEPRSSNQRRGPDKLLAAGKTLPPSLSLSPFFQRGYTRGRDLFASRLT